MRLLVGPTKHADPTTLDFSARNPYAVVDIDGTILLQYVNTTNPTSSLVNYQMTSHDDGMHWTVPTAINLGKSNGTLMGPGNGIVLGRHSASVSSGRMVICGCSGYVGNLPMEALVWFSDDHGTTWTKSNTSNIFSGMGECQVVELNNGSLVINMRNRDKQHDRAISMSLDGGLSFENVWHDAQLPDPTCSAGLINMHGTLYFSNDPTTSKRKNMTLKSSTDNGISWHTVVQLTTNPSGYSVVVPVDDTRVAVVYETGRTSAYETIVFAAVDVTRPTS
jgi:sialidase-1